MLVFVISECNEELLTIFFNLHNKLCLNLYSKYKRKFRLLYILENPGRTLPSHCLHIDNTFNIYE